MIDPLSLYAEGLLGAARTHETDTPMVRLYDGTAVPLPLGRFVGVADVTERQLLRSVRGPVLDVGCGPGRHLHVLAARGVFALGVDLSPVAVALARGRGARAIVGSIFDELPGAGTWRCALLLDGNIGIGGAPGRLLERLGILLAPDGEMLVELDPPDVPTVSTVARIESASGKSSWFPWARVSVDDIAEIAVAGGFLASVGVSLQGRWFARLVRGYR